MPAITPFTYYECLPEKTLNRVPQSLKIKGTGDSEVLLIMRLLSGSLKLEHANTSNLIIQKENYFSADLKGYQKSWDKKFPKLIGEDYTSEKFSEFIDKTKGQNKVFYKNILSELAYYFYYQSKGIHSSAFVYLYRALEHLSYALPLIYVSKSDDFSKTFKFLKELMSGDKNIGELGFFKHFIKTIYLDDPIYESSIDFPMLLQTEAEQQQIFTLLKSLCTGEMIADSTESPRVLSIKYTEVGSFIITIRNRFFHFLNGGFKNIETHSITNIDTFFSLFNKQGLYWLSTILLAVISHNITGFETIRQRIT